MTLAGSVYAQSHNPLNNKPANVKICRSTSSKKIKEMTIYKADGTDFQKFCYEYNNNGLLLSELESIWDKKNADWKNYKRETCAYDADNRLAEKISFFWRNDNWVNDSKKNPVYNSGNVMAEEIYCDWSQNAGDWNRATIKYTYSYDEEGFQTAYLQHLKEVSSDTWNAPNWKVVYTRNPAGQVTEELGQTWNNKMQSWINSCKYVYNYDAVEHRMNVYYYLWKENQWVEDQKTICIYDSEGDLERAEYYRSFDDLSLDAYCIYTYTTISSDATGMAEAIAEEISVYPNPTTSYLDLKIIPGLVNKTANLYDTTGKLIKHILLENNVTRIDLSRLPDGFYFIKVDDRTIKIVKQ